MTPCSECANLPVPGALWPWGTGFMMDDGTSVERCDQCRVFADDEAAAEAVEAWLVVGPDEPMVDAIARLAGAHGGVLHEWADSIPAPTVLCCEECSCIFLPDDDGGTIFPDRFERPDNPHDCGCHAVGYMIERAESAT